MASSSSDNYSINLLNAVMVHLYGYGNLIIYVLGIVGNLISITIFLQKKWRKNVCVLYFLICLLLGLVILNNHVLPISLMRYWNINISNSHIFLCKLMLYLSYIVVTLVPTILIVASIDRLLISSQNVDTRLYSSRRLACLLIGTSAVFWILFNLHIPINANIQQFGPSRFVCTSGLSTSYANFVKYSSAIINSLLCLLMIVLSLLSFKNVRRIRAVPRKQQRKQIRSMTKKDFQLLRCLLAHDVIYILLSICSTFFSVYKIITNDQIRTPLQQAIIDFLTNLLGFNYFIFYCSSVFIFTCLSRAFRQEIKRLIYKMTGKILTTARVDDEQ